MSRTTPLFPGRLIAPTRLGVLLAMGALALDGRAESQKSSPEIATVQYQPGGPTQDGYESAMIQVEYYLKECFGTVNLLYRLKRGSLQTNRVYWLDGERHDVQGLEAPNVQAVEFEGRVSGMGGQWSFSVTADVEGSSSCMAGEKLGKFSEYWGPKATSEEKRFALNSLGVVTASAGFTAPALTHNKVAALMREKKRAAEQEAAEQQRRAEAERARVKAERAGAPAADAPAQGETASQPGGAAQTAGEGSGPGSSERTSGGEATASGEPGPAPLTPQERDAAERRARRAEADRNYQAVQEKGMRELDERLRAQRDADEEKRQQTEAMVVAGAAVAAPVVQLVGEAAGMAVGYLNRLVNNWTDVEPACRVLSDFRSSGSGCQLNLRFGGIIYFNAGLGFFTTPAFEKYLTPGRTIVDASRATNSFLEVGPGVALWPTRQLSLRAEAGAYLALVTVPESKVLHVRSSSTDMGVGLFAGAGINYRLPSTRLALAFNYRLQGVRYAGMYGTIATELKDTRVGYPRYGTAHTFGVGLIVRFDHAKAR